MTDEQLLTLLETKSPEELTAEEIELLRERLKTSPILQAALSSSIQMEAYLAAAFGTPNLSAENLIARGAQQRAQATRRIWTVALTILLLASAGVAAYKFWPLEKPKQEIAEAPTKKIDSTKESEGAKTNPPVKEGQKEVAVPNAETGANAPAPMTNKEPGPMPMASATPAAPAPMPEVVLPWSNALALHGDAPSPDEVVFTPFSFEKEVIRRADLVQWLDPVPNEPLKIQDGGSSHGQCAIFEGIGKLKAPLVNSGAIKLSLERANRLQIHCFQGDKGVTLQYFEDQDFRWVAYCTTREAGKPRPNKVFIAGTDDGRGRRTELRFGGPLELSYEAGEVRLSRGDILLVSAPLAQRPDEVYFEGNGIMVPGIALVRHQPLRALAFDHSEVQAITKPADLKWEATKPESAKATLLPDGSVRIEADPAKERSEIMTPLPGNGLYELVFELSDITPGSSVFLGNAKGVTEGVLRFFTDRRSQQMFARMYYPDDSHEIDAEPLANRPLATVQNHCYVKFLYGCGNLRWWISPDGVHWAQPDGANDNPTGQRTTMGLQVVGKRPGTGITLKRVSVRELTGITQLASKELVEKGLAILDKPQLGNWLAEVTRKQPADVDSNDWRRACAIQTLGHGCPRDLAYQLLELLLDDAKQRKLPLAQQRSALVDAYMLCWDLRDGAAMQKGIPTRMLELGMQGFEQEAAPAWSSVREAYMSSPIVTWLLSPSTQEKNLRWELLAEVYDRDRKGAQGTSEKARFFRLQPDQNPLLDWVDVVWGGKARVTTDRNVRMKEGWRHPWIEDLSKESYSLFAEIRASLEGAAWEDAARQITSLGSEGVVGLSPAVGEEELFTSLPVALRLAISKNPDLRQTLSKKFAALAKLRLAKATAEGDTSSVELATIQFADTEAAGEAHRWLGDRALADGRFSGALAEYAKAESLLPSLTSQLLPRRRLAAACLGQDFGVAVTQDVRFGDIHLPAAEFEKLVAEMRARGTTSLIPLQEVTPPAVPGPTGFQVAKHARLDGPVGVNPGEEVNRRTNQFQVPWVDRQIATALEGDLVYVSNRFQVACYNLTNGQRAWQTAPPPGNMAKSQDWACIAMHPLLTKDKIFVRQLYGNGPQLACYSKGDGKLVWSTGDRKNEFMASDPVILEGELGILSIVFEERQEGTLCWNLIDAATGEIRDKHSLIRLRNTWGLRACCEVLVANDRLYVATGGSTLCLDVHGKLDWLRRHTLVPAEEDPRWILQRFDRPYLSNGRIYAFQPGMRCIECIDQATGGLIWRQVIPEVTAVEGIVQGKLLVRCEEDLRALELDTGKLLWKYVAPQVYSHLIMDEQWVFFTQRQGMINNPNQQQIFGVWLDPKNGAAVASTPLAESVLADPRQGPIFRHGSSLWTFFGNGQHEPTRDLIQLTPKGPADKLPAISLANTWLRHVPTNSTRAALQVLPEWKVLSCMAADRTGLVSEAYGEKDVLGLKGVGGVPVVIGRGLMLPAGSKAKIRIRVASDPGIQWKLETRFGDSLIKSVEINDQTFPDRWKTIEIELADFAGQTGWLSLEAHHVGGGDGVLTYWKSIELVF